MADQVLHIKGTLVQIQQNTSYSSQTITDVNPIVNVEMIDKILESEAEFNNLYGIGDSKIFKDILLELRQSNFKNQSSKKSLVEKLESIAIGASGNVIGAGILHFISQI